MQAAPAEAVRPGDDRMESFLARAGEGWARSGRDVRRVQGRSGCAG